jgi:hypothetical protein
VSTVTKTIVGDNSSYADFKGWAGDVTASAGTGTGIAAALYTLGFTKLSDTYTAQWDNGTTNAALSNPNSVPLAGGNLFGATFATTTNHARAALASSAFQGAWSVGTAYTVGQVVTYTPSGGAQQVYICWATGGIGVSPAGNSGGTSVTYWAPYYMEIWSMVASGLDTVYVKLEYGGGATATNPQLSIQFGSAYSANSGVLSGNVSTVEQCFVGTNTATSSACNWASDGQNWFACFMHRANTSHSSCIVFERAISGQTGGAPVYSNGSGAAQYITYLVGFTTSVWHQCSLFLGSVSTTSSVRNAWASPVNIFSAGSQIVNNITPAIPCFPLVGWLGNPLSAVIVTSVTDTSEGVQIAANTYGSSTNYLSSINAFLQAAGGTASIFGVSIKWQ